VEKLLQHEDIIMLEGKSIENPIDKNIQSFFFIFRVLSLGLYLIESIFLPHEKDTIIEWD